MSLKLERLLEFLAAFALMSLISASPATMAAVGAVLNTPDVSDLLFTSDGSAPVVDPQLTGATGPLQLVVQLGAAPLSVADGLNAKQLGSKLNAAQQRNYLSQLGQLQDQAMSQIRSVGGSEIARVSKALDALIVNIDASKVNALASFANVRSIRPVQTYEVDLTDVVPYIGAQAVQNLGFDGTGVRVAVLDSGIDYTHADEGGAGTA